MIFATTGTQLPFPRLIAALDGLAPMLDEPIRAQIGPDPAPYPNLDLARHLTPTSFEATFAAARVIVAHAGIGTILAAKRHGKPLILVPRRHELGEHRNDHQLATAAHLEGHPGLQIAWQISDLEALLRRPDLPAATETEGPARAQLTGFIGAWIAGD